MEEGPSAAADSLWFMGYDVQKITPRVHEFGIEQREEDGEEVETQKARHAVSSVPFDSRAARRYGT